MAKRPNNHSFAIFCPPIMIGRLFRLFLLFTVLIMLLRWLFNREQRQTLHQFVSTLAIALLASSLLMAVLVWFGVHI